MPGEPTILFRSYDQSPIGQIGDAAYVYNSTGVPVPRVLGSYALIFLIEGQGIYADVNHKATAVSPGDMLMLFPDIAHRYGPSRRGKWSEFYILFHGPVFDLWRSTGILTPQRPVFRLGQVEPWLQRMTNVVDVPITGASERQIVMVSRLQSVIADIITSQTISLESGSQVWLTEACHWLESELAEEISCHWVADMVGLSYDRFRKKFAAEMKMTPYQYRSMQRLKAAQKMMLETEMSLKEIAASVGFYDEFALSNRFKQVMGMSPRAFRAREQG